MPNPEKNRSGGSEGKAHARLEEAATSAKGRGKQPKGSLNPQHKKATKKVAKKLPNLSSIEQSMAEMQV